MSVRGIYMLLGGGVVAPYVPPTGDCAPYTRPSATGIVTNLDTAPVFQDAATIITNLCSEVS